MQRILILISMIVSLSAVYAEGPNYTRVVAQKGDGAYSLLRRYHLLDYSANLETFYSINGIVAENSLLEGKEYFLPVYKYTYNGQSIRSTIGIDDWDLATKIAEYNMLLYNSGLVSKPYQKSLELWVPVHSMERGFKVPKEDEIAAGNNGRSVNMEIFGPAYSRVSITSEMLKGTAYYIVSGHGGPDPGALGEVQGRTICEDEYAYDVSLRLARKLVEHGAKVEIIVQDPDNGIRDEMILGCDKTELSMGKTRIPIRQLERLKQRVYAINDQYKLNKKQGIKNHIVVCIHVDSRSPQREQDVFFYYCEGSRTGKKLANQLQDTFRSKYEKYRPGNDYTGTVSSRGLYVLKHTDPPAVYVELANIRNSTNHKRLLPDENRQALANWLFEGLTKSQ